MATLLFLGVTEDDQYCKQRNVADVNTDLGSANSEAACYNKALEFAATYYG